jgi:hypothetical protein
LVLGQEVPKVSQITLRFEPNRADKEFRTGRCRVCSSMISESSLLAVSRYLQHATAT